MITNGIQVDPQNPASYNKLPVSAGLRSLIREVHSHAGDPRYEVRYSGEPTRGYERRSAAPSSTSLPFHRPDELAREKLRLRLSLLQRMRA
jgi:hypothetical protein